MKASLDKDEIYVVYLITGKIIIGIQNEIDPEGDIVVDNPFYVDFISVDGIPRIRFTEVLDQFNELTISNYTNIVIGWNNILLIDKANQKLESLYEDLILKRKAKDSGLIV